MKPLISIVINNYNYGEYLSAAIDSALSQSYANCEVIVVDDGSTDDSRDVIERYASRVRRVYKENGGQASAFNAGIAAATGDFILLLDSDDYLFPDAVSACASVFPAGYSRVYFRLDNVDRQGQRLAVVTTLNQFRVMNGYPVDSQCADGMIYWGPPTSGNFFNGGILRSVLPIPEQAYNICADAFVVAKTSMKGPVLSLDRVLGAYRLHGQNAFFTIVSTLSNAKRVNVHIRNYFTSTALGEEACRARGIAPEPRAAEREFWFIHLLLAGWIWQVESMRELGIGRRQLLARALEYLWAGDKPLRVRAVQSLYALSLLMLPIAIARHVLTRADRWKTRRRERERSAQEPSLLASKS